MDKPTCGTCHLFGADGFCYLPEPQIGAGRSWPRPSWDEWCVAHQDWADFIATRTPHAEPIFRPGDALYWDEHGQRCMRLATPPTAPPSPPPTPRE